MSSSQFQWLFYFLYYRWDRVKCKAKLRNFPPKDRTQEAEFRKLIIDWIEELRKEPNADIERPPSIVYQRLSGQIFVDHIFDVCAHIFNLYYASQSNMPSSDRLQDSKLEDIEAQVQAESASIEEAQAKLAQLSTERLHAKLNSQREELQQVLQDVHVDQESLAQEASKLHASIRTEVASLQQGLKCIRLSTQLNATFMGNNQQGTALLKLLETANKLQEWFDILSEERLLLSLSEIKTLHENIRKLKEELAGTEQKRSQLEDHRQKLETKLLDMPEMQVKVKEVEDRYRSLFHPIVSFKFVEL